MNKLDFNYNKKGDKHIKEIVMNAYSYDIEIAGHRFDYDYDRETLPTADPYVSMPYSTVNNVFLVSDDGRRRELNGTLFLKMVKLIEEEINN